MASDWARHGIAMRDSHVHMPVVKGFCLPVFLNQASFDVLCEIIFMFDASDGSS